MCYVFIWWCSCFFYVYVEVCTTYMYEDDLTFHELNNFTSIKETFFKCLLLHWIYEWLWPVFFMDCKPKYFFFSYKIKRKQHSYQFSFFYFFMNLEIKLTTAHLKSNVITMQGLTHVHNDTVLKFGTSKVWCQVHVAPHGTKWTYEKFFYKKLMFKLFVKVCNQSKLPLKHWLHMDNMLEIQPPPPKKKPYTV